MSNEVPQEKGNNFPTTTTSGNYLKDFNKTTNLQQQKLDNNNKNGAMRESSGTRPLSAAASSPIFVPPPPISNPVSPPLNRFHLLVLLSWQLCIFFASQMLFAIFATYTPRWKCNSNAAFPQSTSINRNNNFSFEEAEEILKENNDVVVDEIDDDFFFTRNCSVFEQCASPAEEALLEFEPIPFASAALEFNWICGAGTYYKALYSQIQFAGVLLGTILMAPLSDRLGRKPVGLTSLGSGLSALVLSSFSTSTQMLLAARFLVSFLMGGSLVVMATYTMEIIPPNHRMTLRTFCNWGFCRLTLTLICFLFPDWRSASAVCALVSVPALFILGFCAPESPTWLHSQGRLEEMRCAEQKIARVAGVRYVPVEHEKMLPPLGKKGSRGNNFLKLVRNRVLFGRLLVLWVMWFCSSFSSYSVDLNSTNFSGDLFVNQWILSCPVIVSKMFLFLLDSNWPAFSRRVLHQCAQTIACLSFLLLTHLIFFEYNGIWILLVNLLGIIFLEFTWDANVLCAVESMPTEMRASTLGSCSMMARIGGIFAPVLVFLNEIWGASAYLAVTLFGALNLFVSYNWLVDTKGVDLDTVNLSSVDPGGGGEVGRGDEKEEEEEEEKLFSTTKKRILS